MPDQPIYNRFDAAAGWERLLFRPDRVLQSAELNELQSLHATRVQRIADALFKEGDIVRAAQCITEVHPAASPGDSPTATATLEAGALYVAGAVRNVPAATLAIAATGTVSIGVYLQTRTLSELDDPALNNPAAGTRGYGEPGALREVLTLAWGTADAALSATFLPVWTVNDGSVLPKAPPPNIDGVTRAIARYDRQATGGTYAVDGLQVQQLPDLPSGEQVYSVRAGSARIAGNALTLTADRRIVYAAQPDLQWIDSEPHTSAGVAPQRIAFDRTPAVGTPQVRVQARKTAQLTHGGFTGAADALPDPAILLIESVTQGGTAYQQGSDWQLSAGQIDWSAGGAEPAPGSSYEVTYQHIRAATPSAVDASGFTIAGALEGTLVLASYNHALRRWDRLVLRADGTTGWITGPGATFNPRPPQVPPGTLALASVYQSWDAQRRLQTDGVRVVPMNTLVAYQDQITDIYSDLAELRLAVDVSGRFSGIKRGLFADPMLGDATRDAGQPQDGVITGGALNLPMAFTAQRLSADVATPTVPPHTERTLIEQPRRTECMQVNPYMAFGIPPAELTLDPPVDRWVETRNTRLPDKTIRRALYPSQRTAVVDVSESAGSTMRALAIAFRAAPLGPGEVVQHVRFDGVDVTPEPAPVADAQGVATGTFQIPQGTPAGTKLVEVQGLSGSVAQALYTGEVTIVETTRQTTIDLDPLAQTFSVERTAQISAVELQFCAVGSTDVIVQLRAVTNGYPARGILASARRSLTQAAAAPDTWTRFDWPPVTLSPGQEYALVVLCNDATTALAIARLGAFDASAQQWVTNQPYQVGVLLSSSNNSTWSAHQDADLAFRLLQPVYDAAQEYVLDLGSADVQEATDLVVVGAAHEPALGARLTYRVTPGAGAAPVELLPLQALRLEAPLTGSVHVAAVFRSLQGAAPVLAPGTQLVAAALHASGTYITPAVAAGAGSTLHVVLDALLPAGSSAVVHAQALGSSTWDTVPYVKSSPQTAGFLELTYALPDVQADQLRVRLTLSGSTSARPQVRNLRVAAV